MTQRYRLFRRRGYYYAHDRVTGRQESLHTSQPLEAKRLLHAKNEADHQPAINLQIARAYLAAADPGVTERTWQQVMEEIIKLKEGSTRHRWETAINDSAFDSMRRLVVLETRAEHFLRVLEKGKVSTNLYLRRIHNFALDMNWLPWSVLPKKQWPTPQYGEKRAITPEEHQLVVENEGNAEKRAFYQMLWHLGGAQGDVANLTAENIDWGDCVIGFPRQKTGTPSLIRFGQEAAKVLESLPKEGPLFPTLKGLRASVRADYFRKRCALLCIRGVTLHSYRYAWAERAKRAGYPERFAQEALGHNSKAVHRAYARKAQVKLPSLEEFETNTVLAFSVAR
jgi:integrase